MTAFEDLIWLFNSDKGSRGIVRLNIAEGALLYKYCREKRDATLLEIGRKHGGSTAIMSAALDSGTLYSVDIVEHAESRKNTNKWSDKIHFITANSRKIKWDTPVDLLFIDGDHSYEGVRNDIKKFTPFVRNNGVVIFHDVIGKKCVLLPLIDKLQRQGWNKETSEDSMLVLRRK